MDPISLPFVLNQLLSWRAMVDILLLATGLFFLYRTLMRLGTWKIAVGVLAAILVYLFAALLDLRGIEWVFGNVSHVAVIALIVIFQPELRKVFERAVSVRRAEGGGKGEALARIVEEGAAELARQKRGAIVVFPGREPVREWLSGGVGLDAEPSLPLLLSLFDPHSPGHDGALIIRNGKFVRYGTRLPISETGKLPQQLGTRHHAAMGLAEKTDALVLVVSEERGVVSLFRKGEFAPVEDLHTLADTVIEHWRDTASHPLEIPKREGRRTVTAQLAASVALAVLFWSTLVISQAEMLEKVVSVPVEYAASPANLMMVGDKQQEVRLHLSGPKSDLDALNPAQMAVRIDLSKAAAGKQTFMITGENIRLPRGVSLLDVAPESLSLNLAEIVEQELRIKPQLIGKVARGFKLGSVQVSPSSVRVLLPAETGKGKMVTLSTTPIYLEGLTESTHLFCKIVAPPSVQPVDKRWPDVEVSIEVAPEKSASP
jgi:DNA integrity scanning protein DisA with diadenylate cyclase activity